MPMSVMLSWGGRRGLVSGAVCCSACARRAAGGAGKGWAQHVHAACQSKASP